MICHDDEDHYNVWKVRQNKLTKNNDTPKEPIPLPVGSTVANQNENGRPSTHGTIIELCYEDHSGWLYEINIRKTGE